MSAESENKLDLEGLKKIKGEGNEEYKEKRYESALSIYEKALKCVNIDIYSMPSSLTNDQNNQKEDVGYYKEILNTIELNTSFTKDIRSEISKIFSNRAACYLHLKKYKHCIHESNIALLYNSSNEKGLFRRALSYEKLEQYTVSLANYQKLLQLNSNNKDADKGCKRVQAIITKKRDRVNIYTESINELKKYENDSKSVDYSDGKKDNKIVTNIAMVMNQMYHTQEYHAQILDKFGFTHILFHFLLAEKYTINLQIDCLRALNAIIKHATDNKKYSQQNQKMIIKAFECNPNDKKQNYIKLLIEKSKIFLAKLINIFENKDKDKKGEKSLTKEEGRYATILMEYLINIASNQYLFEKYSDEIFNHLVEYFKKLKYKFIKHKSQQKIAKWFKISNEEKKNEDEKEEDGKDEEKQKEKETESNLMKLSKQLQNIDIKVDAMDDDTIIISDVLVSILKHLSNKALTNSTDNYNLLEKIRYTFFYQFLLCDFSKDLRIKNEILRYFVCCSGLKSVLDQVNDSKLSKLKTEYEKRIIEALSGPIIAAYKDKQFTSSNIRLVKALRGLSIMLQSNHKLGCDIAAKEDILNCIVEVATINQPANDFKYDNNNTSSNAKQKAITLNAINENDDDDDQDEDGHNDMEKYDKYGNKIDMIGYLGCEVLALSCSNSVIRDAIIKSNNQHLFAWILDTDDLMVRAYSANALAKFAAIDEDSRELALGGPNRCMYSCAAIIHYLLQNEKKIINNKSINDLENNKKLSDYKKLDKNDSNSEEDEYRNYKVPLMNLCVETISYLSLHLETKLGIIHNKNEILKLLVSISSTRYFLENRSLRHGLLTIILNCSLSKEDVNRYMSEKEEQLAKLRKVVSKGLPKDPTKQDEIIQSRAGDKEKIKMIQKELIKENCMYLIYNIVKFTNQENKKLDSFINDEIGMTSQDEIKQKNREEQARKERYSWDPNKYTNESEKAKLQRKKLAHFNKQKTKYRSFELEEKLQMKICQVLMMMSDTNEFRGNLVQQKAIRLSMDLFFQNKNKVKNNNFEIRQMSSVAVARICISINPILLNINDVKPIIEVLLKLISEAQHELYIYEALLALCNIASMKSDDIKIDIAVNKNGWSKLRNAFEDEHPLINAAILEVWCNLCTCYEAGIVKLAKNCELDVQIVTLFLQHDSKRVQRAAVSILALATSVDDALNTSKDIAAEIAKNGGVLMLQCLLNIRQGTLIERFNENEDKNSKELDKIIIERIRIVMDNLERFGYTMHNIDKHGMKKEVMEEFQSYLKK